MVLAWLIFLRSDLIWLKRRSLEILVGLVLFGYFGWKGAEVEEDGMDDQ
jgi:hypothetical protein